MPSVADDRQQARLAALRRLAVDLAERDFEERHPELRLPPIVALICAFEEADNLGDVLAKVPTTACGLEVGALVVVDGGDDGTDKVAIDGGATTFVLPVNLGHGVALRIGYDLCLRGGAAYVVTLDADGQNDPGELEELVRPVVEDRADFVVGSRRLGQDETEDRYRQLGVVFFATLMNRLTGAHLTDTSSGLRALRAATLADVAPRLEQDQYQTSELLVTALLRGWRVTERPTVWHERASGQSKKGKNLLYGFRYAAVLLGTWRRERR
ncbi:MAG TPA: glycosyltransferase family 2 protein [Acidimicrobiales bacterium]|nr:glycosyltransferase family 2 protein [Acidimicrobiales bacterium]